MVTHRASSLILLLCAGCSTPSTPCPTDQQLLERFASEEARFGTLAKSPDDEGTKTALGIEQVIKRSEKPARIWFSVWSLDFFGPGGCSKGYAWCEKAPATLVDNIDQKTNPGGPGSVEVYRAIKGNWYLYYQSAD